MRARLGARFEACHPENPLPGPFRDPGCLSPLKLETIAMHSTISRVFLLPLCALAFVLGCASPPGGGEVRFNTPASTSGQAKIEVDASELVGDRLKSFLVHGGSNHIGSEVAQALMNAGKNDGSTRLKIRITRYRLRSSSSAFLLGAMAGADTIACEVEVERNGASTNRFNTDTSTILGGLIMPGSTRRFNRLARELASRIAAGV